MSAGAASLLKLNADGQTAVRVRRVNPPEAEKATLRAGKPASERLDTPEMLLSILRKRVAPAPSMAVKEKPPEIFEVPQPSPAPTPASKASSKAPIAASAPKAVPVPVPVPVPASSSKPTPKPAPTQPAPAQAAPVSGGWFVQVAALSSKAKADQLARQLGGTVQPAGSLFRVRIGPHANEAAARAALGPIAAKGYRDARITR